MTSGVRVPKVVVPRKSWKFFEEGNYEWREISSLRSWLKPTDRVLDIGGGIGVTSVVAAKICGSRRTYTLEPNRGLWWRMRIVHVVNRVWPRLLRVAVDSKPGTATLFVSRNIVSSSLLRREGRFFPKIVQTFELDDLIDQHRPTVVCCDVEGMEVKIFPASRLAGVDTVVLETHPQVVGSLACARLEADMCAKGYDIVQRRGKVIVFRR